MLSDELSKVNFVGQAMAVHGGLPLAVPKSRPLHQRAQRTVCIKRADGIAYILTCNDVFERHADTYCARDT